MKSETYGYVNITDTSLWGISVHQITHLSGPVRSAVNIPPQHLFLYQLSPAVSKRRLPWPKVPVFQVALQLFQLVWPEALVDPWCKFVAQGWDDVPVAVKTNLLTHLEAGKKKAKVGNNLWRNDRRLGDRDEYISLLNASIMWSKDLHRQREIWSGLGITNRVLNVSTIFFFFFSIRLLMTRLRL